MKKSLTKKQWIAKHYKGCILLILFVCGVLHPAFIAVFSGAVLVYAATLIGKLFDKIDKLIWLKFGVDPVPAVPIGATVDVNSDTSAKMSNEDLAKALSELSKYYDKELTEKDIDTEKGE